MLADHPGRIYTRERFMDARCRDERVIADRTVDNHVKKISSAGKIAAAPLAFFGKSHDRQLSNTNPAILHGHDCASAHGGLNAR